MPEQQSRSLELLDTLSLAEQDARRCKEFLASAIKGRHPDLAQLLASIPTCTSSYGPMATLSALLSSLPGPWPVLRLQLAYVKSWKMLPEKAKSGEASMQTQELLDETLRQCQHSYSSFIDLLHSASTDAALIDPETGHVIHHHELSASVRHFKLPIPSDSAHTKPVVAIALPNGPLLAMATIAAATYYTVAPLAYGNGVGAEQFKADALESNASIILASPSDISRLGLRDDWLSDTGIMVLLIELEENADLMLRGLDGDVVRMETLLQAPPNCAQDTGLLLFTSGTSGTRKLVPVSVHSMICGVAMIIQSWGLEPTSRCLNQMPLNHIGGLLRNLFAPIMSGGSVICCGAFDANHFWDCVDDLEPTWYYASPTMHQCILEASKDRLKSIAKSKIKLVCNAAGGLLPSLACQLRDTFDCTVLPSYGMTECMPISTPPLTYELEKTGTSGVSVGPEIAIFDDSGEPVKNGISGYVYVRGSPVFAGYLKDTGAIDNSCFTSRGWFDTGDMGYMNEDSYLYLTGRSKEVINRGGELISPFEVEEAISAAASNPDSPLHGRVSTVLAFSVPHAVLQEVVGVVITKQRDSMRTCLQSVQEAVRSTLAQVKIPVLVVYMDEGLPTNNNKILRIRLAERLGLPEISDDTPEAERHFEAICPPPNTPLKETIECKTVATTYDSLEAACQRHIPYNLDFHILFDAAALRPKLILAPKTSDLMRTSELVDSIHCRLFVELHGYEVPTKVHQLQEPFPRNSDGSIDMQSLDRMLSRRPCVHSAQNLSATEETLARVFGEILPVSADQMSGLSDFFELGGDSMRAGRLLSCLRKEFQLRLPIDILFVNRQISSLASLIDTKIAEIRTPHYQTSHSLNITKEPQPGCEETYSSTRLPLLLVQLLPLLVLYPMKRALTWTVFMYCLSYTQNWTTNETTPGRLLNLVVSMTIARAITKTVAPMCAIIFKWTVIGRFEEGLYPMWGPYHTKWWLCQKVIAIAGMGNFGIWNWSRVLYYRFLGATIGRNAIIDKNATLGEYDLLTLGDGAVLDRRCIARPFAAERNTSMYLGRICIGANASLGLASVVAPGTSVPENACIGPNSSSWEVEDADEVNRSLTTASIAGSHWLLNSCVGIPIQAISTFIGALPWLLCLLALVRHEPIGIVFDALRRIIIWFASSERISFHYLALAANASLGPVFFFVAVLSIKKILDMCFGRLYAGDGFRSSQITIFRRQLMRILIPAAKLHKLTELFGTHYEATSVFMRALGAHVGKQVYWPGTGPSIQDHDLLEIGDNVVFGSRSHFITSDGTGSDVIRIGNNAMVADRVVLLPGVELGEKTVLGSGALTKRNSYYTSDTTWVGSKHGEAVCLTASSINKGIEQSPLNLASYNSSRTTLVKNADTSAPKKSDLEKGHGVFWEHVDRSASTDAIKSPKPSIKISEIEDTPDVDRGSIADSSSPFGRAFYCGQASYRVWTQFEIFLYSTIIAIGTAIFWNIGSVSAVQLVGRLLINHVHFLTATRARPVILYAIFLLVNIITMAFQSLAVLLFLIAAKWILIGRRRQGNYDWDKSSYCQRWQLFLKLESLRRHCYAGHGILGMLTGTHWIVLYFRALGATIGKECALFAGGLPSLMFTEPDLLILGDRVAVDDASLVAHINTRGKFDLNPLSVGDRSVLRTGSRLLSGARMEADSCLLEHTLVMSGDVVESGTTSQGWPAEEFKGSRMPTLQPRQIWSRA